MALRANQRKEEERGAALCVHALRQAQESMEWLRDPITERIFMASCVVSEGSSLFVCGWECSITPPPMPIDSLLRMLENDPTNTDF